MKISELARLTPEERHQRIVKLFGWVPKDLDDVHKAELHSSLQDGPNMFLYVLNLVEVLKRDNAHRPGVLQLTQDQWIACCIFASASQRSDALLLTLG